MNENAEGYQHYVPMVPEDATWESKLNLHLIRSIDELKSVIEAHKDVKYVAFDTETTGLNADVDRIVGFSIAFSMWEGWYIPIRHIIGVVLDPKEALDLVYQLLLSKVADFMFNMRFDCRMMEVEGYDMSKCNVYEVQLGVYLADTNYKRLGLKLAERRWLGWLPDSFTETVGDKENFSYTNPEESYKYACVDACGTFGVAGATIKYYRESKVAGKVLNEALYPFMKFEDIKYEIDKDYLLVCQMQLTQRLKDLEHEIYNAVGYQFKIGSNVQLGNALQSVGISTGSYTKTGQMKVDIKTFEVVNRTLKSPLLNKLIEYSQLTKLGNSYIDSLLDQGEKHDYKLRFHYILGGTGGTADQGSAPTGRVSSGADKKNDYFAKINIMAIPKPHSKMYYVHHYKEGDELKEGDVVILDWRFSLVDKSEYMAEGMDQNLNIRSAFIPPKGWLIVSRDFSAQELICQANLANVKGWVNTFNSGGDLHEYMAKQIWGAERYNRDYRKKAKTCFGVDSLFSCKEGAIRGYDLDVNKHHLLDLDGNEQEYAFFREKRPGYRVELSNGQIVKVTNDHKFRVYDEFVPRDVPIEELSVGRKLGSHELRSYGDYQEIVLPRDRLHEELRLTFNEDLAYLCGVIIGDGCVDHNKSTPSGITIVAQNDNKQKLIDTMSVIGDVKEYVKGESWGRLSIQSRRFARWFESNFGSTTKKHIGDIIFVSPKSVMLSFLAGLLDTDGRVNKTNITYLGINENLLRQVADLVALLGFSSNWVKEVGKCNGKSVDCYGVNIYYEDKVKDIPLRIGYKRDFISNRKKSNIAWEILDEERCKFEEHNPGRYEDWHYNFMKGNSRRFNRVNAEICNDIRKDYSPVKIVDIEPIEVDAICLECKTHEFSASALDGPNCNFGLLYGMSAYTMAERINESVDDTKVIIDRYWKGCPEIPAYQKAVIRKAKKDGTIYTYFGLPRRLKYYMESSSPKLRAFGERSCANTMIQGTCSTITLIAALKMWHKLYNNDEWKDKCRFQTYIHDEIVSAVRADKVAEFGLIQKECMEMTFPNLPVKFSTSMSLGVSWGNQFDFHYEDGKLVPDMEHVTE